MRTFALVVSLICASSVAIAQTVPTFDRADYAAASAARAIASADFDRDGWLDLATAGRDGVTILLNTGSGGFTPRVLTMPNEGAFDMAAGDLDRDAVPDLVVAQADGDAVDVLIGHGDGTFAAPRRIPIAGGNPRGLALVDYDRDGKLDIIVTEYATGAWRILYGDGAGAIARQDRFGGIARPQGVLARDFNRDGRPDLAMASTSINMVAVFLSTGTTGLVQRNVTVGGAVHVLAAGDYNGDGWLDLSAASTSNSTIYTLHGNASGLAWKVTTPSGSSPRGIVTEDLNQDGRLDLITANRASATVNVHLGSGTGTFGAARAVGAGSGSRDVAAGDFDHDGRIDLATSNEFGSSTTVLTNATPFVAPAFRFTRQSFGARPGLGGPFGVEPADFDRNGRLDAVVWANDIDVWLSGRGKTTVATGANVNDVSVADLNADGAPDLAAADYWGDQLRVFLNRGDGTFVERAAIPMSSHVLRLATADLNRDGRLDIITQKVPENSTQGAFVILLGRGDGSFTPAGGTDTVMAFVQEIVTADLDGDGNVDAVGASGSPSNLTVWYGKGDGTSSRLATYAMPRGVVDVAVADLNEDGRLDLISAYDSWVYVLSGLPGGNFAPPAEHLASIRNSSVFVYDIEVGDVNLDGHVDVLTNDADVLFGKGDGSFTFDQRSAFDGYYQDPEVVDFNGDGLPDFLFNEGGGLIVMLNERDGANHAPTATAPVDLTVSYPTVNGYGDDFSLDASGSDPDLHELRYEWRNGQGTMVSTGQFFVPSNLPAGQHTFTVTVDDGRGGRASDSMVLTVLPYEEINLHAAVFGPPHGAWRLEFDDPTAASQVLFRHPNANAPKLAAPLATPVNYIEASFPADPAQTYKLWLRLRADNNYWGNDSVFVQFEGATDENGRPVYQIGSTSALAVNLEECSGCGLSGWGWEDDGWGARNLNGTARLRFPNGRGRIRIQTREDGVAIDQVALSAKKYLTVRPGTAKNDTTILEPTVPFQ